jgi:hypothetical protein
MSSIRRTTWTSSIRGTLGSAAGALLSPPEDVDVACRDQHRDDTSDVTPANNRDCGSIDKTLRRKSVISHFLTWLLPVHTTHQRRSWTIGSIMQLRIPPTRIFEGLGAALALDSRSLGFSSFG